MQTIQTIDVNRIDPDSTINVRRQGIDENVEKSENLYPATRILAGSTNYRFALIRILILNTSIRMLQGNAD